MLKKNKKRKGKTMNKNTKYLDTYRRMEAAIKASGKYSSVKEYEDSLEDDSERQGELRICRMMRNYMEHENITFLEASDQMIEFVENLAIEFNEENVPVKKKMIGIRNAIRDTDLIVVAADYMTKKKTSVIPIFNKDDFSVGILTYENIVKYIASGDFTKAKKVSAVVSKHKFGFINENVPINQVRQLLKGHNKVYLILNDNKKVVGWIV